MTALTGCAVPLLAEPAHLGCAPGVGGVEERGYLAEKRSAAQPPAGSREQCGLEGVTRGWHPPAAAEHYVPFVWPVQFRGRRSRRCLGEDCSDHAPQPGRDSGTELAGLRGDQQLLVGEGEQQAEPAVVVPLDADCELAQVGVPWVVQPPGERGRVRGADDQVLGGEEAAELLMAEAHSALADSEQRAAQNGVHGRPGRQRPRAFQEQGGLRNRERTAHLRVHLCRQQAQRAADRAIRPAPHVRVEQVGGCRRPARARRRTRRPGQVRTGSGTRSKRDNRRRRRRPAAPAVRLARAAAARRG